MWLAENEGAKFWLNVLTELKNRGLNDILIACVDGLKGFPEAINAVNPETQIQLCIVHMVRNSLRFVAWKDYKAVLANSLARACNCFSSINSPSFDAGLNISKSGNYTNLCTGSVILNSTLPQDDQSCRMMCDLSHQLSKSSIYSTMPSKFLF